MIHLAVSRDCSADVITTTGQSGNGSQGFLWAYHCRDDRAVHPQRQRQRQESLTNEV